MGLTVQPRRGARTVTGPHVKERERKEEKKEQKGPGTPNPGRKVEDTKPRLAGRSTVNQGREGGVDCSTQNAPEKAGQAFPRRVRE